MFSSIKNIFLKKYLAENKSNRQKQIVPLSRAKNIAMLCEITHEDSYKDIFRLFTQLQEHGHNVKLIGYIDEKEVPFYCLPQLAADYFCQKNLNWYGKPNMEQIQDFVKEEYDMLIDFNYRYHPAVMSLLSMSRAKFIVGRVSDCQPVYDLFIGAADKDSNVKFLENVSVYTQKLSGNGN